MQSTIDFSGIWIPNITPFQKDDIYKVDYPALAKLIDYLIIEQKATGIVPCGTTGESNTMTKEEGQEVIKFTIKQIAGRVPVMAGTGTNDTRTTIKMTQFAEEAGADAVLVVSPYYNRPDQRGIYAHFAAIAKNTSKLPIFIYNIPARTGRNVEPETVIKLAKEFPNILGIKDVSCDFEQTKKLIDAKSEINHPFYVLSGEDCMVYHNLKSGGDGAISASAHVVGAEMQEMFNAYKTEKPEEGFAMHQKMENIFKLLFKEPNPAPIKACYDLMGFDFGGDLRLPLLQVTEKLKSELQEELNILGKRLQRTY